MPALQEPLVSWAGFLGPQFRAPEPVITNHSHRENHFMTLSTVELCAGAGGQALGIHRAGFKHRALVEIDDHACATLRRNFPGTRVIKADLLKPFDASRFKGIDLLAAGVPCPPFSVAGKQLGAADERNLFPAVLQCARDARPKALMIENVEGLLKPRFDAYRAFVIEQFHALGYEVQIRLLDAADFNVPQRRRRAIIVALRPAAMRRFKWPKAFVTTPPTVGKILQPYMAEYGWKDAARWACRAQEVAPTIVGGSKKHGGADLGPSGSRKAWAALGVNGSSLADAAPDKKFVGMPRLTIPMVARLQGFPSDWVCEGSKTHAYRQVGNALPPQLAQAVARQIRRAFVTQPALDWGSTSLPMGVRVCRDRAEPRP